MAVLTGCGTVELFGRYDLPESPAVADAPYPRLIDVPEAPARGSYSQAAPDPAQGAQVQTNLAAAAVAAETRAAVVNQPVLSDAERARLLRRGRQARR